MRSNGRWSFVLAAVVSLTTVACAGNEATDLPAAAPGARVLLDAHNAYPYHGRFPDRLDRALAGGLPVAIEQDLVWVPGSGGVPGRSVVSHGAPFDGSEPTLEAHFFERIRPFVESALQEGDTTTWPLVVLNLDLKSNEPEHHQALWTLLGRYDTWLTTAERTSDPRVPAPLDVRPVLVLTGSADAQEASFSEQVLVGGRLRLFGAMRVPVTPTEVQAGMLPAFPRATNYRRWWNAPWSVVEAGGQREGGEWTGDEAARLTSLVGRAHDAGLWVRLWTLNGSDEPTREANGWSAGYNFGSVDAAAIRWHAAIAAGVDFVATDQYEAFSERLAAAYRK